MQIKKGSYKCYLNFFKIFYYRSEISRNFCVFKNSVVFANRSTYQFRYDATKKYVYKTTAHNNLRIIGTLLKGCFNFFSKFKFETHLWLLTCVEILIILQRSWEFDEVTKLKASSAVNFIKTCLTKFLGLYFLTLYPS